MVLGVIWTVCGYTRNMNTFFRGFARKWSYGVMVSTLDFESSDPSSSLGRTSFFSKSPGVFSLFFPAKHVTNFSDTALFHLLTLVSCQY